MVVLVLLTGLVTALFLVKHAPRREPKSPWDATRVALSSAVTDSSSAVGALLALSETPSPVRATLSNDQDHDGKPDGLADSLMVLLCGLVVLRTCFVDGLCLVGEFLVRLCEPSMLVGFDYHPALERPG